jgi:imidazolonepropionase-like amidohydrolase
LRIALVLLASLLVQSNNRTEPSQLDSEHGARSFLIKNVRVFNGHAIIPADSVLVEDGTIVQVGYHLAAPSPDFKVVDGTGCTVLPGLIDSHTHTYRTISLQQAILFGVTTEMGMEDPPKVVIPFRDAERNGAHPESADIFTAGWPATAPGGHGAGGPVPTIAGPDAAQSFVDARLAEGSDYIKIIDEDGSAYGVPFANISNATMVAVVQAAHQRGKLAIAHIGNQIEAADALQAGVDGLAHLFIESEPRLDFGSLVSSHRAFVVPTLTVLESLYKPSGAAIANDPDIRPFLTPDALRNLRGQFASQMFPPHRFRMKYATDAERQLLREGVPILAGTDAPNSGTWYGVSLHREMELLVAGGMSPLQALASATSVPAHVFRLSDRGAIAAGMRADLLMVRGDPTTHIQDARRIVHIWKAGAEVNRAETLQRLTRDYEESARFLTPKGSDSGLIADFEEDSTKSSFGSGWQPLNDARYHGNSTAKIKVVPGGADGSKYSLSVVGTTERGAPLPFAGVSFMPSQSPWDPANLSAHKKLCFSTKGHGTLTVWMSTQSQPPHMVQVRLTPQWKRVVISFSAFHTDGSDVTRFNFSHTRDVHPFAFQIDDVAVR